MATPSASQPIKCTGPRLPLLWQSIPIKSFLSLSPLFYFCCVAQDVWSEWRWEAGPVRDGKVICNFACFCSLCKCWSTLPADAHSLSMNVNNLTTIVSTNEVLLCRRLLPVQENFLLKFQVGDKHGAEIKAKQKWYIILGERHWIT